MKTRKQIKRLKRKVRVLEQLFNDDEEFIQSFHALRERVYQLERKTKILPNIAPFALDNKADEESVTGGEQPVKFTPTYARPNEDGENPSVRYAVVDEDGKQTIEDLNKRIDAKDEEINNWQKVVAKLNEEKIELGAEVRKLKERVDGHTTRIDFSMEAITEEERKVLLTMSERAGEQLQEKIKELKGRSANE